jgi:hypothetical protein
MAAISGIDWAAEFHEVHVSDEHGRVLCQERFCHDEAGLEALIGRLLSHRVARVAIERPDGLLVGRLLAAAITVVAIHPNQLAAARDRFRAAVLGLVCALRPIVAQISQLTSEIRGAIRAHPDGPIFLSFFRDPKSVVTAAGLLCEIGDNRARYPHADTMAADGGQAPVTKQSGKHRAVGFRWACDKRLRNHLCVLADSTRHWHPWAHDIYQRAIDRGCDHPHAIRILGRAWTRVLWRCWQDGVAYDPTQHRALTRHLAPQG